MNIRIGDEVAWPWGRSLATGTVLEVHPEKVEIESKGKIIRRNGTPLDPALIIKGTNGSLITKLSHEVKVIKK